MKTRHGITAVALVASLALTVPALAAGGKGQAKQTKSMNQIQKQQRLRDRSCTQSKTKNQTENTYGRGANTSNQGSTTQARSGYDK